MQLDFTWVLKKCVYVCVWGGGIEITHRDIEIADKQKLLGDMSPLFSRNFLLQVTYFCF